MSAYFSWFSTKENIESRETQFCVFNRESFNMKCLEFGISVLFIFLSSAYLLCVQIKDQVNSEIIHDGFFQYLLFRMSLTKIQQTKIAVTKIQNRASV